MQSPIPSGKFPKTIHRCLPSKAQPLLKHPPPSILPSVSESTDSLEETSNTQIPEYQWFEGPLKLSGTVEAVHSPHLLLFVAAATLLETALPFDFSGRVDA